MIHSVAGKGAWYRNLRASMLFCKPWTPLAFMRTVLVTLAMLSCQYTFAQQAPASPQPEIQELQVNVNEADAATIADILVGIGASRARAIVEYREEHGPFTSLEDLIEVNGVGEATVNNNRERIKFE